MMLNFASLPVSARSRWAKWGGKGIASLSASWTDPGSTKLTEQGVIVGGCDLQGERITIRCEGVQSLCVGAEWKRDEDLFLLFLASKFIFSG